MSEIETSVEMSKRIRREFETESRIRQMDAHEIVAEIHCLEDIQSDLYEALEWLGNEVGIYELDGVYLSKATTNHKMLKFVCDALAKARGETS